eukprot:7063597-Pyramimonas_sp.AAC.1
MQAPAFGPTFNIVVLRRAPPRAFTSGRSSWSHLAGRTWTPRAAGTSARAPARATPPMTSRMMALSSPLLIVATAATHSPPSWAARGSVAHCEREASAFAMPEFILYAFR